MVDGGWWMVDVVANWRLCPLRSEQCSRMYGVLRTGTVCMYVHPCSVHALKPYQWKSMVPKGDSCKPRSHPLPSMPVDARLCPCRKGSSSTNAKREVRLTVIEGERERESTLVEIDICWRLVQKTSRCIAESFIWYCTVPHMRFSSVTVRETHLS